MVAAKHPVESATRENVQVGEPGYALGIAGFVTSFFFSIVGLVLSAVALRQSKSVNRRNKLALAGLIIGIVRVVLDVAAVVGVTIGLIALSNYCADNPDQCRNTQSSDNSGYPQGDTPVTPPDRTY